MAIRVITKLNVKPFNIVKLTSFTKKRPGQAIFNFRYTGDAPWVSKNINFSKKKSCIDFTMVTCNPSKN